MTTIDTTLESLKLKKTDASTKKDDGLEKSAKTNTISAHDSDYYKDSVSMSTNDALQTLYEANLFHRVKWDQVNNCSSNRNQIEGALNGRKGTVMMDSDYDGTKEELNLADAVAASYDSELDLYIQEQLQQFLGDSRSASKLNNGKEKLLAEKGIKIEKVGDKLWAASLVDSEGNVLEDEYGNKGSILYCDRLVPDGNIQGIEMNFSSILDVMGYDCISKADFLGKEDEYEKVLSTVEANIQQGLYKGSMKTTEIYDVGSSSYGGNVASNNKDRAITDAYGDMKFVKASADAFVQEAAKKAEQEIEDKQKAAEQQKAENKDQKEVLDAYKTAIESEKAKYLREMNSKRSEDEEEITDLDDSAMNLVKNNARKAMITKYGNDVLKYLPKRA